MELEGAQFRTAVVVSEGELPEEDEWECRAEREVALSLEALTPLHQDLERVARRFDGRYVGWYLPVFG
jgi:hypothetical protein